MNARWHLPMVGLLALAACQQNSAPDSHIGDLLYVFGSGSSLFVIDPSSGSVIARPGPVPDGKRSPVFSADSSTVYFEAGDSSGSAIYALNTRTLRVLPWLPLRDIRHVPNDSLWIGGGELAVGPSGGTLYDGLALVIDSLRRSPSMLQRVALIDTTSRAVTGSIGPIYSSELVTLPAGDFASHGALLALISARPPSTLGWLDVIDPVSHTAIDSIRIPMPVEGAVEGAIHIVPSPDGRRVYLTGFHGMYAFDLISRQIVGRVDFSSYDARLAVSPRGDRVYLISNPLDIPSEIVGSGGHPNPQPLPPPTSTVVRVFDPNLVEQSPISFADVFTGQSKLRLRYAAVSRDGKWLYASGSMTTSLADGFLRVIIIDLSRGAIVHSIPLGVGGQGSVFVGRSQSGQ
jgi:DNA-binding beta-propeller fold protein YncE